MPDSVPLGEGPRLAQAETLEEALDIAAEMFAPAVSDDDRRRWGMGATATVITEKFGAGARGKLAETWGCTGRYVAELELTFRAFPTAEARFLEWGWTWHRAVADVAAWAGAEAQGIAFVCANLIPGKVRALYNLSKRLCLDMSTAIEKYGGLSIGEIRTVGRELCPTCGQPMPDEGPHGAS